MAPPLSGKLFLVPTPIGNMRDFSERSLATLTEVDLIACEDTRHSGRMLAQLDIKKPLISYHEFNERARADKIAERIRSGESVAVITDAGSPGISDPAYRVVRAAIDAGIEIVPLPGPTAIVPALTASGLPTDRFLFEGFLSNKGAARRKRLTELADFAHTIVFYESTHRIGKMLADAAEILGDRPACVAREITKKFEEFLRGTLAQLAEQAARRNLKGELVVVVAGKDYYDKQSRESK